MALGNSIRKLSKCMISCSAPKHSAIFAAAGVSSTLSANFSDIADIGKLGKVSRNNARFNVESIPPLNAMAIRSQLLSIEF